MLPTLAKIHRASWLPARLMALALFAVALPACEPDVPPERGETVVRNEEALPSGGWQVLMANGGAPIRSITRRSDGVLLGGASTGHGITVWASRDNGATWSVHGSVVSNPAVEFGDVTMRAIPGTRTVFCAFREYANGQFRVTVTRSDNDGDGWVYDSTVVGPVSRFVGAPFLFQRANGDLQVYYDSEPLAEQGGYSGHQWIAMQGRAGTTGPWTAYGVVTVSRDKRAGALSREGMATVVQLGGDRLMAVVEGVEPFATGALAPTSSTPCSRGMAAGRGTTPCAAPSTSRGSIPPRGGATTPMCPSPSAWATVRWAWPSAPTRTKRERRTCRARLPISATAMSGS
ncbi:sialidase family protein [Cystobacter fuscus]